MGKSPGKWIKAVIFRKKSSKSNLSKDGTVDKKTSMISKPPSKDFDDDSMVISSPVPPGIHAGGEHIELEKTESPNLRSDTIDVVRSSLELNIATKDDYMKLEQAAIMAQTAFRGYLARKALCALKGIIRIQAHIRGRLVRRQAVATLSCLRAVVEFQALARGVIVRLSADYRHMLQQCRSGNHMDEKRMNLLEKSLISEKLSTNAFGTKLVASSHTSMPLIIQYDPTEPNSVRNWLDRWSASCFWEPVPQPKKLYTKPKRKQLIEPGRTKRSVRRVPPNLEGNSVNSSENEKSKPALRKVSSQQTESAPEQSRNELEKVKHSLRKISVSTAGHGSLDKASGCQNPDASEQKIDQPFEKVNDSNDRMTVLPLAEPLPVPPLEDDMVVKPQDDILQENLKTRRRKSFPAKHEHCRESVLQNTPTLPSYMAATESAKAKLRAQAAEEDAENGFIRRHSLPSSTGKLSLQSPRVQKPLQANGKGWTKSNKPQISVRDDKMVQSGWRR